MKFRFLCIAKRKCMKCCSCSIFECNLHIIFLNFRLRCFRCFFCVLVICFLCCIFCVCIRVKPECSFFICCKLVIFFEEIIRIFLIFLILDSHFCNHLTCKVLEFQAENTFCVFICFRFFTDCFFFFCFFGIPGIICFGFCRCFCVCCHNSLAC